MTEWSVRVEHFEMQGPWSTFQLIFGRKWSFLLIKTHENGFVFCFFFAPMLNRLVSIDRQLGSIHRVYSEWCNRCRKTSKTMLAKPCTQTTNQWIQYNHVKCIMSKFASSSSFFLRWTESRCITKYASIIQFGQWNQRKQTNRKWLRITNYKSRNFNQIKITSFSSLFISIRRSFSAQPVVTISQLVYRHLYARTGIKDFGWMVWLTCKMFNKKKKRVHCPSRFQCRSEYVRYCLHWRALYLARVEAPKTMRNRMCPFNESFFHWFISEIHNSASENQMSCDYNKILMEFSLHVYQRVFVSRPHSPPISHLTKCVA